MEDPMRSSPSPSSGSGLILLIGSQSERPGELPWPALAALSAADAILHDGDVDPRTLDLVPRGRLVERAPAVAARAYKLAQEGWRVVWLMAGDPAGSPERLADAAGLLAAGVAVGTIAGFSPSPPAAPGEAPAPQPFATALNGLAG
jgi:siroheme synthase